ncbi:hypothetical protein MK786_03125 [Microbacterium sp. CFH 31415]|uniref:hypothetical protein n=1 Tax=Microbacterium sp. CFH 31415 TaxID=2921732 RepID=UPI001F1382C0|nr:hypothetical protein [Microbacterium sp. CFH 31415]MCH6229723.1 hypothetical protein [Microbacterium sp. CFH 31415]
MRTLAPAEAERMSSHEVVRWLNDVLGPTIVQALVGEGSREAVVAWQDEYGPEPASEQLDGLKVALQAMLEIAQAEDPRVARAWFMGANPRFAPYTPTTAIREGRFDEVLAASRAIVEDQPIS